MENLPAITGIGLVTPLGNSVEQTWNALLAGQFIRDHARLRAQGAGSRIDQIATCAAREAIANAGWDQQVLQDPSTALVIGSSKGPVEAWLAGDGPSVAGGLAHFANFVASELRMGGGPPSTLSAACASGLHALIHAAMLLRQGTAKRALVIAAEASVHPLFVGSFKRLGVLAPEGYGCRPFDQDRKGFLMSEAAAAVCLESGRAGIRVENYAIGADATHLTGGDPQGHTMKLLLKSVISAPPVDLIHAHATGTILHDPIELNAIESVLGDRVPAIYSHKGAIGHSLGAAGLVAIVLNCKSHQTGIIPPNVQTKNPIESRLQISRDVIQRQVRHSATMAAGFGGAIAAVSLTSDENT